MASVIARLMVRIGGDISQLERSLSKASRKIQDTGMKMQAMGRTMTTRISAPLAAVGGIALKTSAEFESLQQSMNILNGSVEEGARNFERLKEFSATTPLQLNDLAQAQNMLQGFGMSADDAFESLSMIGDIAAVAEGDIKGIGIAFGQAAAEGRLMTRDIRQLINQGVPAIKLLADTMGVAQSEVLDLASQGEISFEVLQRAFREATSEGGLFADGMQKQSQTLGGVFSTMKDNINIALASVGDSMSTLAKNLMKRITSIAQAFTNMSEETRVKMLKVAGLFFISGPVLLAVGKFVVVLGSMLGAVRKIFTAMVAIVSSAMGRMSIAFLAGIAIGQRFVDNMTAIFSGNFQDFSLSISGFVDSGIKGIKSMISPLIDLADQGFGALSESIAEATGTKGALEEFYKLFTENSETATRAVKKTTEQIKEFKTSIDAASSSIKNFNTSMPEGKLQRASGAFNSISEAMVVTTEKAKVMGDALQTSVTSAVTGFAETLGNAFTGDAGASGFFNNLLLVVVDFLNQFGKLLVAAGIAAQAFKKLLANPVAAIIAGGSLIALTTAIRNMLTDTPEMAQGGLAFGPTLAVVGDNRNARSDPEVIAPLSKLQGMMGSNKVQVEGQIRGDVIHLSNIRGGSKFR